MGCFRTLFPFIKGGKSKATAENQPLLEPLAAESAVEPQDPHVGELTQTLANEHGNAVQAVMIVPPRDELPGGIPTAEDPLEQAATEPCPLHTTMPPQKDNSGCCRCNGCLRSILCCTFCCLGCRALCPCCCRRNKNQAVIQGESENVPAVVQTVTTETVTETVVTAVPVAHEVEATEAEPLLSTPPSALHTTTT
ncbi:hypothetical protein Sste5346_007292 [Sporothrix stenoceras]|uniref:Uncharacterized protein n=1 Tax=Sporothrix stenoceras TaxID=5173 RepID=A0ABR3YUK2_9PEZI